MRSCAPTAAAEAGAEEGRRAEPALTVDHHLAQANTHSCPPGLLMITIAGTAGRRAAHVSVTGLGPSVRLQHQCSRRRCVTIRSLQCTPAAAKRLWSAALPSAELDQCTSLKADRYLRCSLFLMLLTCGCPGARPASAPNTRCVRSGHEWRDQALESRESGQYLLREDRRARLLGLIALLPWPTQTKPCIAHAELGRSGWK